MVESTGGGGCRCACQEEYDAGDDSNDTSSGCCSPQVFTSVLLGILSCVLMTGGVFLAFHRWDPMWLIVSGVGVILILIGTILHCCSNGGSQSPRRHSTGGKGCCSRPPPPDHHHSHMVANNGSLTEQLLPLSNARSVSQLSLNMLPGYFPPVVTAYGIEQHSAVVQNINRLVQQQQQQQQQQSQNPGSASPGVASNAGKSFILLSLPGDATPANIQNLVATVYQLDGSITGETPSVDVNSVSPPPVAVPKPGPPPSLILKNAEVQTCNVWPNPAVPNAAAVVNGSTSAASPIASTSQATETGNFLPEPERSTVAITTQTEDSSLLVSEPPIDLMDCSPDIPPICDNVQTSCDNHSTDHSAFANIPVPSSTVLVDVSSEPSTSAAASESSILVDIPEASSSSAGNLPSNILFDVSESLSESPADLPPTASEVLVEISIPNVQSSCNSEVSGTLLRNEVVLPEAVVEINSSLQAPAGEVGDDLLQGAQELANPSTATGGTLELSSSNSNLSAIDVEVGDDGEFLDRSSPPPSYEDVTLESENAVGAFGLAYGTI